MVSPARIRTNRLLAKAFNLNDFLDPTRLAHDELQYYNDLTRLFDKIISHHIDWLDSPEAKKVFYEDIQNREEYFQAIDQDLDDIINDTSLNADKIIEKVYRKGLNYGYKDINRLPVFNDACKYGLKATQEYNFELIRNVSDDLIDSIRHHIFRGVAEGQSIHEVARAITDSGLKPLEGKTLTAYQRASLIARTEIGRSMTTGRLQSYANYGVKKVKILTAGDDNVCPICLEAAHIFNGEKTQDNIIGEKVYSLEDASDLVPFHPACRCSVIAYIEHYNDIPQKPIENPHVADLINNKIQNWSYTYEDNDYQFQGNTPEGRDNFQRKYGVDVDKLDDLSKKFLIMYTDDADSAINNHLRKKWRYDKCEKLWDKTYKKLFGDEEQELTFKKALEIYEDIFEKYSKTLEEDIIVCRREDERFMGRDDPNKYHDDGFTSTSIYEYVEKYGDEINYILIPAGTKIIYLEEITKVPRDFEILFAPGIDLTRVEDLSPRKKVWRVT